MLVYAGSEPGDAAAADRCVLPEAEAPDCHGWGDRAGWASSDSSRHGECLCHGPVKRHGWLVRDSSPQCGSQVRICMLCPYSLVHSNVHKLLTTAAHACRVGWTTLCMSGWVLRGASLPVCGTASLQQSPTRRWPSYAARYGETLSSECGGLPDWEWGQLSYASVPCTGHALPSEPIACMLSSPRHHSWRASIAAWAPKSESALEAQLPS